MVFRHCPTWFWADIFRLATKCRPNHIFAYSVHDTFHQRQSRLFSSTKLSAVRTHGISKQITYNDNGRNQQISVKYNNKNATMITLKKFANCVQFVLTRVCCRTKPRQLHELDDWHFIKLQQFNSSPPPTDHTAYYITQCTGCGQIYISKLKLGSLQSKRPKQL